MSRLSIRIRHIVRDDWDGIAALESGAYAASGISEGRDALESRARVSPDTCFVLDAGGRLAGYVLTLPYPLFQYPDLAAAEEAGFESGNLHLHDIVIADDLRGRGLAALLLRHVTDTARSGGFGRISLVAVEGSEPFWSANGYAPHREIALPPGYGTRAVYMSREVPGNAGHA